MNLVPHHQLVEMGKLHLDTNKKLEKLLDLDNAILKVQVCPIGEIVIELTHTYIMKGGTEKTRELTGQAMTLCDAVKDLYIKAFGASKELSPSIESRLDKIEAALEALANKVKE